MIVRLVTGTAAEAACRALIEADQALIGRHPSEQPHATPPRVAQIVGPAARRTDQILDPCAAYTGQRRRPATPLRGGTRTHDRRIMSTFT
jgi:hypothetical protein